MRVPDPVQHRIAHVDVRRRHVDLRAQHVRAVGELAGAHARGTDRGSPRPAGRGTGCRVPGSVSVPRYSRISSAVRLSTYALPVADQLHGVLVQLLEVVRRVEQPSSHSKPSQRDVVLDRLDVLDVFLRRVGVVEAQVARAAELLRRRRSSGRSTWRGRCAGSRSARAGSAWPRARCRPAFRSSATIVRMKSWVRRCPSTARGSWWRNQSWDEPLIIPSPAPVLETGHAVRGSIPPTSVTS